MTALPVSPASPGSPSVFRRSPRRPPLNVVSELIRSSQLLSGQGGKTIVVIGQGAAAATSAARQGELKALPPILTFQSVMDSHGQHPRGGGVPVSLSTG